jgi:cytochrome b561
LKKTLKTRYDNVAITLHWLIAILIIGMLALGWYMTDLPKGPERNYLYNLHKSFGVVTLVLVFIRIFWRLGHRPPALLGAIPAWMHKASNGMHHLLYLAMAVMPLSGFIGSNFGKRGIVFFGIPLPKLGFPSHTVSKLMDATHSTTAWVIAILAGLHLLAALYHQFILKDKLVQRMLPGSTQQ